MIELFALLLAGLFVTGPGIWENLPTCDLRAPILHRCREVRGVWGGTVDGRVWEAAR